jgi:hypothetical protein
MASGLLRIGRKLEARLRIAFQEKIPRLGDRYFHSRLNSDMAGRYHQIHHIRLLPELGGQLLRSTFELMFTGAGVIWLDPGAAPLVMLMVLLSIGLNLPYNPRWLSVTCAYKITRALSVVITWTHSSDWCHCERIAPNTRFAVAMKYSSQSGPKPNSQWSDSWLGSKH